MVNESAGRLYVVATPIGNLGDLSVRAREILQTVSLIAAEDTRHTGVLLKHFGIQTPQVSLHEHNEQHRSGSIIERLRQGASVALVSDAGTPAINDPGFELVRAAAAAGCEIVAVPGPCAAIAALSIGGLPTDRFCFEGFLPARGAARRKRPPRRRAGPTATAAHSTACSKFCWRNCLCGRRRSWPRKSPRRAATRRINAPCNSKTACRTPHVSANKPTRGEYAKSGASAPIPLFLGAFLRPR